MPYFLTDDGCRLNYRVDGPQDRPALVLSNSLGTNLEMWAPQVESLAQHFMVVRYDPRGHGMSDVPKGPWTIERLSRDVLCLLDALGIRTARFCGLSMGGMVGMWLGINAPGRFERLALCNTAAYIGPADLWNQRIETVRTKGMQALVDGILERWFTPEFRQSSPDKVEPIKRMLLATPPEGYAGCCMAIRDMDQRASISSIKVPTLVIAGSRDPSTPPERAKEIADAIKGSKLVVLEAAHLSNVEQAQRFTEELLTFMRS